jgi:hypothetical protein
MSKSGREKELATGRLLFSGRDYPPKKKELTRSLSAKVSFDICFNITFKLSICGKTRQCTPVGDVKMTLTRLMWGRYVILSIRRERRYDWLMEEIMALR